MAKRTGVGRRTIEKEARRLRVLVGGSNISSAALRDEAFVTVTPSGHLNSERVLTSGDSISVTDGGANTTVTVALKTPGTLTVATGNAAAEPHTHAITSSSNPGAAASILASNASGYLQLTGLGIGAAPASNDLHIGTGQGITHADGVTAGMVLRANGTRYVPSTLDVDDLTDLAYATPNLTLTTANAAGSASTVIRSDASILVFDATVPSSLAPDDSAAAGSASVAARRDHEHGIPCAAPTTNLSVSSTDTEGDAASFARSNHTHAIDSSSDPGAAASLLASDASGDLYLQAMRLSDGLYIGNVAGATSDPADGTIQLEGSDDPRLILDIAGSSLFSVGVDANDFKFKINSGGTITDPSDFEMDSSGNIETVADIRVGADVRIGAGLYVGSTGTDPDADCIHYDSLLKSVKSGETYTVRGFCGNPVIGIDSFNGDSFSTVGSLTEIDREDWDTAVPADASALSVMIVIRDSGSAGSTNVYFQLFDNSVAPTASLTCYCGGLANDSLTSVSGIVPCTAGDIWYKCGATGTGTLDVWLYYTGYFI